MWELWLWTYTTRWALKERATIDNNTLLIFTGSQGQRDSDISRSFDKDTTETTGLGGLMFWLSISYYE